MNISRTTAFVIWPASPWAQPSSKYIDKESTTALKRHPPIFRWDCHRSSTQRSPPAPPWLKSTKTLSYFPLTVRSSKFSLISWDLKFSVLVSRTTVYLASSMFLRPRFVGSMVEPKTKSWREPSPLWCTTFTSIHYIILTLNPSSHWRIKKRKLRNFSVHSAAHKIFKNCPTDTTWWRRRSKGKEIHRLVLSCWANDLNSVLIVRLDFLTVPPSSLSMSER